jgi:FdhE protein
MPASSRLAHIAREHPHWGPWLGPLAAALRAAAEPRWARALAEAPAAPDDATPRLVGATFVVEPLAVRRLMLRLARAAGAVGADIAARLRDGRLSPEKALEAAVHQRCQRLEELAAAADVDAAALRALAELAALPLLLASRQRVAGAVSPAWRRGYCPVCGAWPTLAEARGVERTRRLRCGRCGVDWPAEWLRCVYCGNGEHRQLGSLVADEAAERRRVDVCQACRGYLKTLTTLQGGPATEVLLDDLDTVDLDVAALAAGYRRPEGPGYPIEVRVVARPGLARRLLAWP